MSVLRSELRKIIREILSDTATWPDSTINAWINELLRDFSNYFPQTSAMDIACVAGQHVYSFAVDAPDLRDVIKVEYPNDLDPPRFITRLSEQSPNFWNGPYYDLIGGVPPQALWLGESPKTGEQMTIDYEHDHDTVTSDLYVISVQERHLEALVLFCQWQAIRELEMLEAKEPDDSNIVLSMLGLNSGRAERLYRSKIREYQSTESDGGSIGPWAMDGQDRVY